ncbi:MAG: Asp-tRNA(Asn)/Glu-tRNA(Gln) amidotransferase subunit GatC [Patescibacteria group bacterium]
MKIDVTALVKLARLAVSDEELAKLEREIPDILKFVGTIQSVSGKTATPTPTLLADESNIRLHSIACRRNVMRADDSPHEGGKYTETLLKAAPARVDNRIAVKQVLTRKKRV